MAEAWCEDSPSENEHKNSFQNLSRGDTIDEIGDLRDLIIQQDALFSTMIQQFIADDIAATEYETGDLPAEEPLGEFLQHELVKKWGVDKLRILKYDDDDLLEEIFDDIVDGEQIQFNGSGDEKHVTETLNELYVLGVRNAKSFLNIAMPVYNQTTVTQNDKIIKRLNVMEDIKSREMQFENLKLLFGSDDPELMSQMTFSETESFVTQSQILQQITLFLNACNDPSNMNWACVQATIILIGHGDTDGNMLLQYDKPMSFKIVSDHIIKEIDRLHGQSNAKVKLPIGVMVLNGLCNSYLSEGQNPDSTKVRVKYFTSYDKKKTTTSFTVRATVQEGGIVLQPPQPKQARGSMNENTSRSKVAQDNTSVNTAANTSMTQQNAACTKEVVEMEKSVKIVSARHDELAEEAMQQFEEDIKAGDMKKAAIERFLPRDVEIKRLPAYGTPNDVQHGKDEARLYTEAEPTMDKAEKQTGRQHWVKTCKFTATNDGEDDGEHDLT